MVFNGTYYQTILDKKKYSIAQILMIHWPKSWLQKKEADKKIGNGLYCPTQWFSHLCEDSSPQKQIHAKKHFLWFWSQERTRKNMDEHPSLGTFQFLQANLRWLHCQGFKKRNDIEAALGDGNENMADTDAIANQPDESTEESTPKT